MNLLYITYIDFNSKERSGASVRPHRLYDAFLNLGINVKLLECQQNKFRKRHMKVKEILRWLKNNRPDFCYIESPSGPIFNNIDLKLIKRIHSYNIPIGFFYRDIFWLFPEIYNGHVGFIKKNAIVLLNKREIHCLKRNCDIVYTPTQSVKNILDKYHFKRCEVLPPALEITSHNISQRNEVNTCIYVGGVSAVYGTDILIDAFKILNKHESSYRLILVCREEELRNFYHECLNYNWLDIVFASGKELNKYYEKASVGVIPVRQTNYTNLAYSVKLFEYLGHGLPVISTNTTEMGTFVKQNNIGMVCEDNPKDLAQTIAYYFKNKETLNYSTNVKKIAPQNTWICRAQKIISDLT